ncbi:hypothetical protein TNCV_1833361 [Trichonephila clavipes]|nr:hypothetical protein TNCV_1833361 [Trichonephila clavipes]
MSIDQSNPTESCGFTGVQCIKVSERSRIPQRLYEFLTTYAAHCLLLRVIGGAYICVGTQGLFWRRGREPQEVLRRSV